LALDLGWISDIDELRDCFGPRAFVDVIVRVMSLYVSGIRVLILQPSPQELYWEIQAEKYEQ
jgi:hypothetical protein